MIGLVTAGDDEEALAKAAEIAGRAEVLLEGVIGRRVPEALAIDRRGAAVIG